MSASSTYTMWASLVRASSTPSASSAASGIAIAVSAARDASAQCIIPQPDAVARRRARARPGSAPRSRCRSRGSSGHAPIRPSARPPSPLPSIVGVERAGASSVVCCMRPGPAVEVPGPAAEDRRACPTCSTASATARHVEERACLAEGRGAGADHLDAGQRARAASLLLRRDRGVERDAASPGRYAVDRDVVEHQPAAQVLGEVDVRVHEAGRHDVPPAVDHPVGRLAAGAPSAGRPDLDDVAAVHQHRAVAQDPPLGVDGDDRWRARSGSLLPLEPQAPEQRPHLLRLERLAPVARVVEEPAAGLGTELVAAPSSPRPCAPA